MTIIYMYLDDYVHKDTMHNWIRSNSPFYWSKYLPRPMIVYLKSTESWAWSYRNLVGRRTTGWCDQALQRNPETYTQLRQHGHSRGHRKLTRADRRGR